MSKSLLVAQREFLENVRTKTFWIGILIIPLIWVMFFVVTRALEKAKDVRAFAVVDESGWLDYAVQERATLDDLEKLVLFVRDLSEKEPERLAQMPEPLQALGRRVAGARLSEKSREAERLTAAYMQRVGAESSHYYSAPEPTQDEFAAERAQFAEWWHGLSASQARDIDAGLRKERYQRVDVPADVADAEEWLRERMQAKELFAYFLLGRDPVGTEEQPKGFKYVSNNTIDDELQDWVAGIANEEVRHRRFEDRQISKSTAEAILKPLNFQELQISKEGEETKVSGRDELRQVAPIVFVYLLWLTVFITVQMLLTNTIEEKSNRIIEVLLSSVSPLELMKGKVLGIAATGLTMILSWVFFSFLALKFLPQLMGGEKAPDLMVFFQEPIFIASFIGYFIAGYLFYAAILVGVGSVCNSLKEAQNLMNPVMILLIIPLAAMMPIGKDPNGTLAKVLTYIPFFTPFTMMNRAAGPPAWWEYALTSVLMVVSIFLAFWAAAKIFRIGILMTGKPPKVLEIVRWLRAPVGTVPEAQE